MAEEGWILPFGGKTPIGQALGINLKIFLFDVFLETLSGAALYTANGGDAF